MQPITEETIQEIKNRIVKGVHPEKIILFGSYAYGMPTKESDLDLLVILQTEEPVHKRAIKIRKLLRDIRIPKDILVYTPQEVERWKNASSAFITSILKKGRVIYG
ncbi:putative nucleotidyltransferase [Candidatus Methanoperedens nitroreducens]|uniref:Putative nucleotidyltransferase n=1 Tax=Candidatus Methanoperedens nitratireducens TaxID=1392998 RepID=A0A062V239_9EURY|nr:nucleotidyltransferase domain-containing protein [Candidatus Methanoperedens nitroreducens]KCZ73176.1 putative nucleotidyltransferase [Candidatus Methanoperedens nitroreducens]MDJ1422875.1 nucleotidyltransferase domain-containing protein [Candidatus Methanoperedens sp.]